MMQSRTQRNLKRSETPVADRSTRTQTGGSKKYPGFFLKGARHHTAFLEMFPNTLDFRRRSEPKYVLPHPAHVHKRRPPSKQSTLRSKLADVQLNEGLILRRIAWMPGLSRTITRWHLFKLPLVKSPRRCLGGQRGVKLAPRESASFVCRQSAGGR